MHVSYMLCYSQAARGNVASTRGFMGGAPPPKPLSPPLSSAPCTSPPKKPSEHERPSGRSPPHPAPLPLSP